MNWFTRVRNSITSLSKRSTEKDLWVKCPSCQQMVFAQEYEENSYVCPRCDHHGRIGADERLAQRKGIKGVIFGRSGIGKTSLLWTLNASSTLFIDLEAGDLAVEGLEIDTLRPRTWKECRDFAVFIGGPNPALREDQPYSQAHFDEVCGRYGDPITNARVLDLCAGTGALGLEALSRDAGLGPVDVHRQATVETLPSLAPTPEPRAVIVAPTPAPAEATVAVVPEVER